MHRYQKPSAGRVVPNAGANHESIQPSGPAAEEAASAQQSTEPPQVAPGTQRKSAASPRKNASARHGLRREETFRSISSLLIMDRGGPNTINVLRMSLYEMHEHMRYHWVLHPFSTWKTLWDLLSACVVIYYSWMVPFMLCFDWYVPPPEMKTFMKVLDVWGFIDISLRFRTGIIEYGAVVMNPTAIRKAYLHSVWFPIDLVSTIPFEYLLRDTSNASTRKTIKMIKYVKLPRLLRIGRFVKYIKKYKRYSSMAIALNSLLFLSHVAGCTWVALLHPCDGEEAVIEPRCAPGEEFRMYWIAFHHGIVSLLGVSANHIESADMVLSGAYHKSPASISSSIYMWGSATSILGGIVTAVLYGTIIDLVQSWNRAENTFRKKMDQITHEMDALSLPKPLRARVAAYYDYLWLNNRTFSDQINLLKDEGMSLALRQQIAIYLFKDYLQKIPFFQLATDSVLGMICMQLHQVIYMPDDYVIREGEIGRELFMIVKGIVRVMPPQNQPEGTEAKKILLGEGDFFGEIAVVMEVERTRSVRTECMSELCILSREGFDKILAEFPEFATAMKRLIIKRVSEMWQNADGKENIEKMTRLADYQMKKKIATYNHVKRLRSTAQVIKTFVPRLSKVVKQPMSPEALGISQSDLAAASTPPISNPPAPEKDELESIRESEEQESSHESSGKETAASTRRGIPVRAITSRFANVVKVSAVPATATPSVTEKPPESTVAGSVNMEAPLSRLEQRVEQRMRETDAKIDQILATLLSLSAASPATASLRSSGPLPPINSKHEPAL